MRRLFIFLAVLLFGMPALPAISQPESMEMNAGEEEVDFKAFDGKMAFEYSQGAVGRTVGDYTFTKPDGTKVRLSDFSGKPVVISLIFTSCLHVCPMITNNLKHAVEGSRSMVAHNEYTVLTIGFDTRADTPERMGLYARERGIKAENWLVLSADQETIDQLTKDLGFIYYPSPSGFDHLSQTTILTPELEVYRHLYTANFEAPFMVEPLKELIYGSGPRTFKLSGFVDQVRIFCTFFDPKTGRYRFDYSLFIGLIVGSLSLVAIGLFVMREWLRVIRKKS